MTGAPALRTARLELRPLLSLRQLDGLLRVTEAAHGEHDPPRTPEERHAHGVRTLERSASSFASNGYGLWLLHRPGQAEPCGWCGLKDGDDPARPELMYGLVPGARGQGLATEAVRALVAHAMALPGTDHVWGAARPENTESVRVMARAELVFSGNRLLDGREYVTYRFPPVSSSASAPIP
jgi:RimJ/RimL family protein N-acetyltransferase